MDRFRHLAGRSFGRAAGIALLLLLTLGLATQARANRDIVQFGNSIDVPQDGEIHDAVCFFCSINVKGVASGNLVSFFGTVRIDGQAKHDVVVFFGDVKAAPNASIGNNLVNFFGTVQLGEDVSIGRDTVVMFGTLRAAPTASFGGDRVVQPIWALPDPVPDPDRAGQAGGRGTALYRARVCPRFLERPLTYRPDLPARPSRHPPHSPGR